MSDKELIRQERIRGLERRGYNTREAEFLCLAALVSGFFLRRQFVHFTGRAVGGSAAALVEKLMARGDARATTFGGGVHIYHLCARPFYTAIGEENNRNRRLHQPASIKARLMALDFVLAHSEGVYLHTEREKLDFFQGELGLDSALLPSVRYVVRDKSAERFFVEKFPIFHASVPELAGERTVSFCYVDEGAATTGGFETFLRKYEALLTALPDSHLIYTAASETPFSGAARVFSRYFEPNNRKPNGMAGDALTACLHRYFELRQLVEQRQWKTFDRAKVIQYRKDCQRFRGPKFDDLYSRWMTERDGGMSVVRAPAQSSYATHRPQFSTYLLADNYELFATAAL